MKCPFCSSEDTKVIDSRARSGGYAIRRRRECLSCQQRFTTYEQVGDVPVVVVKKDTSRVAFDREKIRQGLAKACYKRPITLAQLDEWTQQIESKLIHRGENEISSQEIGAMVMDILRKVDQVAYVRFASVYREFKDVSDFEDEIRPMLEGSNRPKRSTSVTPDAS